MDAEIKKEILRQIKAGIDKANEGVEAIGFHADYPDVVEIDGEKITWTHYFK